MFFMNGAFARTIYKNSAKNGKILVVSRFSCEKLLLVDSAVPLFSLSEKKTKHFRVAFEVKVLSSHIKNVFINSLNI